MRRSEDAIVRELAERDLDVKFIQRSSVSASDTAWAIQLASDVCVTVIDRGGEPVEVVWPAVR